MLRRGIVALVGALGLLMGGIALADFAPVGSDLRISNAGSDGDTGRFAAAPDVAFNPGAGQYLVVWDDNRDDEDEYEIHGQIMAADGQEVGGDFQISAMGDETREGFDASVAFNPGGDEYLVVWVGDGLATDEEYEVFGQRLEGDGDPIGGNFRISNVGADTLTTPEIYRPNVAFNTGSNRFLVAWDGENAGENEFEIYGRMVSDAGAVIGSADFQISNVGAGAVRGAFNPSVASNPATGEFLVAWEGENTATDEDYDIWAQRLTGLGADQGGDFRVSTMDQPGMPDAFESAIATNPENGEMLVVWQSGDPGFDAVEVFGQRLDPTGGDLGGDFRISNALDVDPSHDAGLPAVSYSTASDEYLVTWFSDATANEAVEIMGQRLSAGAGELGSDFQISKAAATGAGHEADPTDPTQLAYDSVNDRFLSVWSGDGLATDEEYEIFGRLLDEPPAAPPTGGNGGPGPNNPPVARCKGKVATKAGTAKRDVLRGTPKADVIVGLGGNDKLLGLGGKDLLCGGRGKDTLKGGAGKDRLFGEAGKDVLRGGPGKDVLNGGPGKDNQKQ